MSFARYRTMIVSLAASAALSGCAGNGNGLDSNGNPVAGGGGGTAPLTADFQSIQDNVFTPICTMCHQGASAPEVLLLDATHSFALLVGVASAELPIVQRVAAGDPVSSYIIRKLEGAPGITGQQMPFGGPYLPQATINVIRQWITNGAQKTATAQSLESAVKSVQRFAVNDTSPDDGSIVSTAVPRIVVEFNGAVDSNMVNNTTVTVASGESRPVLVTTTIPQGNPDAVVIEPRVPLGSGTYRVTLHGPLANMNAQALGADVSFTFTVDALQ